MVDLILIGAAIVAAWASCKLYSDTCSDGLIKRFERETGLSFSSDRHRIQIEIYNRYKKALEALEDLETVVCGYRLTGSKITRGEIRKLKALEAEMRFWETFAVKFGFMLLQDPGVIMRVQITY